MNNNDNNKFNLNRNYTNNYGRSSTEQFNYSPSRESADELPAGQTRHLLMFEKNKNNNAKRFENQHNNNQEYDYTNSPNKISSKVTRKKSHNIVSSVLLLIQELNRYDLQSLKDEINKILR